MKVPAIPVSSRSVSARKAFVFPGLGTYRQVYTAHRNDRTNVRTQRGRLIPSIPT
ncbi:MAG: hypothetical protein KatS3mg014_2070 [Actinomycetota bacterium]|nr:MAG: hypothetical protein KatS3mg014_2070 [Actinomycetota bacterium]